MQTKMTRQEKDFEAALAEQRKEIEALTAGLKKHGGANRKGERSTRRQQVAPRTVLKNH